MLRGPIVGTGVVAGVSCKHICSGGGQGQKQVPGPTVSTLAAAEDLAVGVYYCGSRMAVQQ